MLLWVVLLAQDVISSGAIVAAIVSSVAIVFFVPHSVASAPSHIVGGHLSGVVAAYIVVGIGLALPGSVADATWFVDLSGAVALGLVVLLMSVTNTEHAPAAGTALGLAVRGTPGEAVLFIITAAVIVAAARVILGPRLHNLL
ncbi:MAG: HPP family protein [Chloroflexi bacterium]|nr:HPP family protein [Chloroflexota bacterium]